MHFKVSARDVNFYVLTLSTFSISQTAPSPGIGIKTAVAETSVHNHLNLALTLVRWNGPMEHFFYNLFDKVMALSMHERFTMPLHQHSGIRITLFFQFSSRVNS